MSRRPGPVARWVLGALVTHHVVWPVVIFVAMAIGSSAKAGVVWVMWVFVWAAPITVAGTLLYALALAFYARMVARDASIEATASRLVRNCACLSAIAASPVLAAIVFVRLGDLDGSGRVLEWCLVLGMPIVVGFVNLLVPRLLVGSLRRGAWPGPSPS